MTSDEKRSWILGLVGVGGYLTYLAVVLLGGAGYAATMLWTVGASIVVSILLHLAVTFRGPHEPRDERDREIAHFGDLIGNSMVVLGGIAALVLALLEVDHVWIANVLYLGFVLSAALGSMARLSAYRRGLPERHAW